MLSICTFGPCIFPRIVPFFEFFTQPTIPFSIHKSLQNFVKDKPREKKEFKIELFEKNVLN